MVHTSPFTEGAFRRRSVAERGWRRLQARFAGSSQEAQSLPDPDEGSALNGWTGLDERRRKCRPDNARSRASGPGQEVRWLCKKSPRWSAGKARVPVTRHAGAFARGAQKMTLRRSGAPPPHGGNEDPGEKPGTRTGRADVRKARAARSRERAPF